MRICFITQQGASFIYPDRWEAYRDAIPEDERHDFLTAYHKRLTSDDPNVRLPAALAWTTWERTTSNLIPPVRRTSCLWLLWSEYLDRLALMMMRSM